MPDEIIVAINRLGADINRRHGENVQRLTTTDGKLDDLRQRVDNLHDAFPDRDFGRHRRYHEAVIAKIEARAQFYADLRTELATKGIWAVLVTVCAALWFYFKSKLAL